MKRLFCMTIVCLAVLSASTSSISSMYEDPVVNAYYVHDEGWYTIEFEVISKSNRIPYTIYTFAIEENNIIDINNVEAPSGWYIYRPWTLAIITWDVTDKMYGISPGETMTGFKYRHNFDTISEVKWYASIVMLGSGSGSSAYSGTVTPVPEPASLIILSAGLAGFAGAIRRRRRA